MAVLPEAVGPVRIQQSGPSRGRGEAPADGSGADGKVCGAGAGRSRWGNSDSGGAKGMSRTGEVLEQLERVIATRRGASAERSYTSKLLAGGAHAAGAKVVEEAGEFVAAAEAESDERVVAEGADLFYHALVLLAVRDLPLSRIEAELARRFGVSGLAEKASRSSRPVDPLEEAPSA
jgi:phosphoribosyl-ATP pyrophosphohydrolase